jgi:hypothetical protein
MGVVEMVEEDCGVSEKVFYFRLRTSAKESSMKDEDFIEIGGKLLKRTPGQVDVGSSGEWVLHKSILSDCGRYQNYKLYRDIKSAPKKVWHLTIMVETGEPGHWGDYVILQEYYPGMTKWFMDAIQGDVGSAPSFPDRKKKRKNNPPTELPSSRRQEILGIIRDAWDAGTPLSIHPQTKAYGRFAPQVIGQKLSANQKDVRESLIAMMAKQLIESAVYNKQTKLSGLRLTGDQNGQA